MGAAASEMHKKGITCITTVKDYKNKVAPSEEFKKK